MRFQRALSIKPRHLLKATKNIDLLFTEIGLRRDIQSGIDAGSRSRLTSAGTRCSLYVSPGRSRWNEGTFRREVRFFAEALYA